MKKLIVGAAALVSALVGLGAGGAQARPSGGPGWRGGGWHGGGGWGWRGGPYRGYGYGYGPGGAVFAGLAGVAVGAALASPGPYYYGPPAYYGYPRAYYGGCRRQWLWSPRWGAYRIVSTCY